MGWDSPTLCKALLRFMEIPAYTVPEEQEVSCDHCGKCDITEAVASEISKGDTWFCTECAVMQETLWIPHKAIEAPAKKRNIGYSKAIEAADLGNHRWS